MMAIFVALVLAVFATLAASAGYKKFGMLLGVAAFLTFMGWLAGGPGSAVLDWIDNPSGPDIPSVDINK
jgi:hypothetical protein